jgi:propionyl-CoA synthetase
VVLKEPSRASDEAGRQALQAEIMHTVDQQLGAVARPSQVHFVNVLPKTRSGKLLRRAIQAVCEGRTTGDLSTIEDPTALEQLQAAIGR